MQRRLPLLKEYAQIKQNMDLQEQLHIKMKQEQGNMYASGRGSNPSGGISAFRGGASTDGMLDHGVPMIADSNSEAMHS